MGVPGPVWVSTLFCSSLVIAGLLLWCHLLRYGSSKRTSERKNLVNSDAVMGMCSKSASSKNCLAASDEEARLKSALILSTSDAGMPGGPDTPNQLEPVNFEYPSSANVGTFE